MLISKHEKKLMAVIMTAVIVLSSFLFMPKSADAAEASDPQVSVLGATLRLDNNETSTQSMRIGIKVNNADKAKDCAIKLTMNGRSYTVATSTTALKDERGVVNDKMHSIDTADNSVVYAVVLTNIPKDKFYDAVTIEGRAVLNDEAETTVTSSAESRNVMGIVNALQSKYPSLGIKIADNGALVKNDDTALTAADLEGYNPDSPAEYETEKITKLGNSFGGDSNNVTKQDNGDITVNETGLSYFTLPIKESVPGDTIIVHVTGTIGESSEGLRIYPSCGNGTRMVKEADIIKITEKGNFDQTLTYIIYDDENTGNNATTLCVKGPTYDKNLKDVTISSVEVTYKGGNPAPTQAPEATDEPGTTEDLDVVMSEDTAVNASWWISKEANTYGKDGSVTANVAAGKGIVFYFNGDKTAVDPSKYSEMVVTLSSSQSNTPIRLGVVTNAECNPDGEGNSVIKDGIYNAGDADSEAVFEFDMSQVTDDIYGVVVALPGTWGHWGAEITEDYSADITVKSVKLIAKYTGDTTEAPDKYVIEGTALKTAYANENGGPQTAVYNESDNAMSFSFTGYTGVIYTIPDNTIDTSVYKYAQITYTSSGGSIDVYSCQSNGKYLDNLTASDNETVVTLSDLGYGALKLFHWGHNADTDIQIKSIAFYKNDPTQQNPS